MSHQAEQINVICTDPRIQKFYYEKYIVINNLFGKFDTIEFENPILAFLNPSTQTAMLERIGNYIKLHNPKKVVLIDHTDCGAYKLNDYKFTDQKDELNQHNINNTNVKMIIEGHFSELKVEIRTIMIDKNDNCSWR
jgi:hypothetical protein